MRVVHPWDPLKQHCMFPALVLKKLAHVCWLTKRDAQHLQPLLIGRQIWIPFQTTASGFTALAALVSASIPLGITPDLFQTWVLPWCTSMWARV